MAETAKSRPTIFYIRHGETDWNVTGRLQGRRDVPLNARGRTQAMYCGDILRGLFAREGRNVSEIDFVSSPLGRARTTMELVIQEVKGARMIRSNDPVTGYDELDPQ